MNFEEQLKIVREQKRSDYLKRNNESEKKFKEEIEQQQNIELLAKKIETLTNLRQKYGHLFASNPRSKAARTIQRFVKKHYFEPLCINEEDIDNIPPIYRIRINITNYHSLEYSEENIPANTLDMHRLIYKMLTQGPTTEPEIIYFRYCFDIRKLYPIKNQIFEIYNIFYFMQPNDHIRINATWRKINNETNESIRYLTSFEYYKSLSIDMYKNVQQPHVTNKETIMEEIGKILNETQVNIVKNPIESVYKINNIDQKYVTKLIRDRLDAINREYINNQ